jgi:hypothetical protein
MQYYGGVERLLFAAFGPLIIAAVLFLIVMGIRGVVTRFSSRLSSEQLRAMQETYRGRLLNPRTVDVERELGKKLPERLLQLYEDKATIQSGGFTAEKPGRTLWRVARWTVYCFEPLDTEALGELPYEDELGPGFCFATTGRSCWYWMAASDERAKDAPVVFLDYEGGGSHGKKVADTLDEFLSWPRVPMK